MKAKKSIIEQIYSKYVKRYPNGFGWPDEEFANIVYECSTRAEIIPWKQIKSIIDVGAGTGNFLYFLRKNRNYNGFYTGVEIFDYFYNLSIENFKNDTQVELFNGDFLEIDLNPNKFDWGFCLGTLGTFQEEKEKLDAHIFKKLSDLTNLGFSIYVNDRKYFNKERLKEVKGLYAHDIDLVLQQVEEINPKFNYEIVNFPKDDFQRCSVNIKWT
ncbi:class I SAM-dependent methyltransferase [Aureivirga marina]|uniref:class I SAM-dependent methyltransferase n=1 Tax=Aureivirga marina TaxID=1182451 RepID=UPI0018CBC528|nr:class I SAM-dependent methyltransferase [Aureivirga marina]